MLGVSRGIRDFTEREVMDHLLPVGLLRALFGLELPFRAILSASRNAVAEDISIRRLFRQEAVDHGFDSGRAAWADAARWPIDAPRKSQPGSCRRTAACPPSISKSTIPKLYKSPLASGSRPAICSGLT